MGEIYIRRLIIFRVSLCSPPSDRMSFGYRLKKNMCNIVQVNNQRTREETGRRESRKREVWKAGGGNVCLQEKKIKTKKIIFLPCGWQGGGGGVCVSKDLGNCFFEGEGGGSGVLSGWMWDVDVGCE